MTNSDIVIQIPVVELTFADGANQVTVQSPVVETIFVETPTVALTLQEQITALVFAQLGAQGIQGTPGTPGVNTAFYTHTQSTPSAVWVINHNLTGFPTAVVMDSANTQCEGEFSYTNNNQMVISFSASFSGVAYII